MSQQKFSSLIPGSGVTTCKKGKLIGCNIRTAAWQLSIQNKDYFPRCIQRIYTLTKKQNKTLAVIFMRQTEYMNR